MKTTSSSVSQPRLQDSTPWSPVISLWLTNASSVCQVVLLCSPQNKRNQTVSFVSQLLAAWSSLTSTTVALFKQASLHGQWNPDRWLRTPWCVECLIARKGHMLFRWSLNSTGYPFPSWIKSKSLMLPAEWLLVCTQLFKLTHTGLCSFWSQSFGTGFPYLSLRVLLCSSISKC